MAIFQSPEGSCTVPSTAASVYSHSDAGVLLICSSNLQIDLFECVCWQWTHALSLQCIKVKAFAYFIPEDAGYVQIRNAVAVFQLTCM